MLSKPETTAPGTGIATVGKFLCWAINQAFQVVEIFFRPVSFCTRAGFPIDFPTAKCPVEDHGERGKNHPDR
ncbi:hypothetical protein ACQZ5K_03270 [Agrobacterium sp. 22-226-1]